MLQIIPAVIPTSLTHLEEALSVIASFTHEVQIDVVDGKFVPSISWPFLDGSTCKGLAPLIQDFVVEIDCMMHRPEETIQEYVDAGASRIVVHLESALNLPSILELKAKNGFELGFSISNDTDIRALTSVLHMADYVQLMGIAEIGSQGQPFDTRVLTRIRETKSLHPELLVSIDGSVNQETVPKLVEAGADRFIAGSAIFGAEDPHVAYNALIAL